MAGAMLVSRLATFGKKSDGARTSPTPASASKVALSSEDEVLLKAVGSWN